MNEINWCICTDGLGTGDSLNLIDQCQTLKKIYPHLKNEILLKAITEYPKKFVEKFLIPNDKYIVCKIEGIGNLETMYEALFDGSVKYEFMKILSKTNESIDLTQLKSKKIYINRR